MEGLEAGEDNTCLKDTIEGEEAGKETYLKDTIEGLEAWQWAFTIDPAVV